MLAAPASLDTEMNRIIRYLCLVAALGATLCGAPRETRAQTPEAAQAEAKLAAVRGQIAALTSRLGDQLKRRDVLNARLRAADLGITVQRQRLDRLRGALSAAQRRRDELRAAESHNRGALEAERAALGAQVRSAYMLGEQEPLKLLLNQNDPAAAGRMLAYYGYLARERTAKIDEIREQVVRDQALVAQIEQTSAKLQALQADTAREVSHLQLARDERVEALAAVMKEVSSGSEELAILKRQEQAEESLVAEVAQVLQDFPVDKQQNFDTLRGKLPWPVPGRITARYQESRITGPQSAVRWNGVLIETSRGTKVRAPCFGRVVYADWLQGLGLLLIIGHSGNYMTLYGHAEVLYKSVGDWVAPGDVIAAMGDAGAAAPQLYFEIRDGRKTVDPKAWLKAAP